MQFLQELSIQDLMKVKGIGKVKAIQIKAVCELAKRISKPIDISKIIIKSTADIANIVMDELKTEKREIVKVVILNSKNAIIKIQTITQGSVNAVNISPKDILLEAVKMGAPKIILIHNHPSGDARPSVQDCNFTRKLEEVSKMLGILLLDHIVIGYNQYTSIKKYLSKEREKIVK